MEQCWTVAGLGVAAVGLNWITTGDHLLRTIGNGYWPVAGVDLSLLVTSSLAVIAALKLRRRSRGLSIGENETQRGTSRATVAGTARA
jgi:hypothetical protein